MLYFCDYFEEKKPFFFVLTQLPLFLATPSNLVGHIPDTWGDHDGSHLVAVVGFLTPYEKLERREGKCRNDYPDSDNVGDSSREECYVGYWGEKQRKELEELPEAGTMGAR